MKANNILIGKLSLIAFSLVLVLAACKKTETFERVRLFRPVPKDALVSEGNWVRASWQPITDAESYTAQISKDTFRTILASVTLDTNVHTFENLEWEVLYQVRVRANAADTTYSSRMSDLGAIKTARFPTILNVPLPSDITDEAVKVSWVTSGAPVTTVKILKASDNSVVTTVTLTPLDITSQFRIVNGLASSTAYIIYLYSGASVRGWANFSTTAPYSGNIIDLRGITGRPSVLTDTLPLIADASTVLLKRGQTYTVSATMNLSKSVKIVSGADLATPGQAIISLPSNFNIVAGSSIAFLDFQDVSLIATDYTAKYVFNISNACTIARMGFEGCRIEKMRGVVRLQTAVINMTNFIINNCIIDSVSNYGVINVDNVNCAVANISIKNSTIYKTEKVVTSKQNSTSVIISDCTFNEAPFGNSTSSFIVDYGALNVSGGITISNCIFGKGKPNADNILVRDVRAGTSTSILSTNNYITSDHTVTANPLSPVLNYSGTSLTLFQDPYNGNFKINDVNFLGKSNSGDPKWRL